MQILLIKKSKENQIDIGGSCEKKITQFHYYISCGIRRFLDADNDLHADASILTFLSGMFFHFKVKCK